MTARVHFKGLALAGSLAMHTLLFVGLGQHPPSPRLPRPVITSLVELRPEPEPIVEAPPPPKPAVERAQPTKQVPVAKSERPTLPSPQSPIAPAQPPPSNPLRLAGVRLSNAGGTGLAVDVGAQGAPSGSGSGGNSGPTPATVPATTPSRRLPRVVALSDLSQRPIPPNLDAELLRYYPTELRRRGVEGQAVVRLRLSATGSVQAVSLLSESDHGFGQACRRMLRNSRWSPGLDDSGRAVSTSLVYRCRFTVGF